MLLMIDHDILYIKIAFKIVLACGVVLQFIDDVMYVMVVVLLTYYDCAGNCLADDDDDGICNELEVFGCTSDFANNYNMDATEEDGSCEYSDHYIDISREGYIEASNGLSGVFNEFTIEAVVRIDDYASIDPFTDYIIDIGSEDNSNNFPTAHRISILAGQSGVYYDLDYGNGRATYEYNTYDWMKVTGVWKGGEYVKLFINDVLVANDTTNVAEQLELFDNSVIRIGKRYNNDHSFDGAISNIKIWEFCCRV